MSLLIVCRQYRRSKFVKLNRQSQIRVSGNQLQQTRSIICNVVFDAAFHSTRSIFHSFLFWFFSFFSSQLLCANANDTNNKFSHDMQLCNDAIVRFIYLNEWMVRHVHFFVYLFFFFIYVCCCCCCCFSFFFPFHHHSSLLSSFKSLLFPINAESRLAVHTTPNIHIKISHYAFCYYYFKTFTLRTFTSCSFPLE